jgi:polysaccharide biosynthesis/export protein
MTSGSAMKALLTIVGIVLIATVSVCSGQTRDYVVGAPDTLTITVWNQPNLSGKFSVEADGSFTFPLIGRVTAGGLTLRGLETELNRRLADGYLKNPQVSVSVETYRSQQIFIVGEVRSPGAYPLTGNMTLIEALARAGSTTSDASGEAVILRAPPGSSEKPVQSNPAENGESRDAAGENRDVVRVQLDELETGAWSQNIRLQDGDTIFISRTVSLYVFGQVKSPGAYRMPGGATVLQALSLAGGVTDRGATGRIKIIRVINGQKTEENKVKLDDPVRPGDTIVVPERYF